MQKREFIGRLRFFLRNPSRANRSRGQEIFVRFLINYLEELDLSVHEQYDFWHIELYLPELLVAAVETFRTGMEPNVIALREMYEVEAEHKVPNVTDFGASNIIEQSLFVQSLLCFTMKEVTEQEWVEGAIDKYVKAQQYVVQQTFDRFVRHCYSRGMFQIIAKTSTRGVGGKFGNVHLRTYVMAGRTMITFARKKGDEEEGLSFVSDDSDPMALSAGLQSVQTDFRTALDMIDMVIANWPSDPKAQAKVFAPDKKIQIA
jgi:hypothetical protein